VGRAAAKEVIVQMINEVVDRCDVYQFSMLIAVRYAYWYMIYY